MNHFVGKANDSADQHDGKADQALTKVGDQVDERTDGKQSEKIDNDVDTAQQRTGAGDTAS
jgi:hypothetical protein